MTSSLYPWPSNEFSEQSFYITHLSVTYSITPFHTSWCVQLIILLCYNFQNSDISNSHISLCSCVCAHNNATVIINPRTTTFIHATLHYFLFITCNKSLHPIDIQIYGYTKLALFNIDKQCFLQYICILQV